MNIFNSKQFMEVLSMQKVRLSPLKPPEFLKQVSVQLIG